MWILPLMCPHSPPPFKCGQLWRQQLATKYFHRDRLYQLLWPGIHSPIWWASILSERPHSGIPYPTPGASWISILKVTKWVFIGDSSGLLTVTIHALNELWMVNVRFSRGLDWLKVFLFIFKNFPSLEYKGCKNVFWFTVFSVPVISVLVSNTNCLNGWMNEWFAIPFLWGSLMAFHPGKKKSSSSCLNFLTKYQPDNPHTAPNA